jgi:tRNA G18 (ribose-2'-O)-methylase SpoU
MEGFRRLIFDDVDKFNDARNIQKHLKKFDTDFLRSYCKKQSFNFNVCILSLFGNLNVGTIIRSSNLCGARNVIVFGKRKYDKRSAVGSEKYTEVVQCNGFIDTKRNFADIDETDFVLKPQMFYDTMIEHNCVPIFLEQHKDAVFLEDLNLRSLDFDDKTPCFIFGNEGEGIPNDIIKIGLTIPDSMVITIRQVGVLQSFNVSAACVAILTKMQEFNLKKVKDIYL